MSKAERSAAMCVRCQKSAAPEPLGFCATCVVHTRIEMVAGLRRLGEYLAAWAAFEEWCRARGESAASA